MSLHNIKVSIDLNKIDESRVKPGKNGARYYDMVLWANDAPDAYGNDFSVKPGYTKAELDMKPRPRLPYIGNAKIMGKETPVAQNRQQASDMARERRPAPQPSAADEDVPF